MPVSRWHQDKEVAQLIEHLETPDKFEQPDKLTPSEIRVILKELDRCRKDFVYAARNYFWITNKDLGDQLFTLWPGQELILEKVLEIKGKNRPQKLIIVKARQLGSLDPDTKVLTTELKWVRLGDVKVGDRLVSVDEESAGNYGRRLRGAAVKKAWEVEKEAYRITFDNGQSVIASEDHPFLTPSGWLTCGRVTVGDSVRHVVSPWEPPEFEDGWFGGLLDAEGSFRRRSGFELSMAQTPGDVLNRAESYLKSKGCHYRRDVTLPGEGRRNKKPVVQLVLHGLSEIMSVLGSTIHARFNGDWWEGAGIPRTPDAWAKVVSIEEIGERRMVDVETTTGTFIANGFITHNCSTLVEAMVAWRTMFFSNVNALVVSFDRSHTAEVLFPIMTFIYDRMPWWLKPMCAMRKGDEGLHFENPKPDMRGTDPGINSRVYLKGANSTTGIGMGIRLSCAHISEFCAYDAKTFRIIINRDMVNALVEDGNTFAILESTAKGANTDSHRLWKRSMELLGSNQEEWYPLFLPWFFEATRVRPVMVDFRLERTEFHMRERIKSEWVRCDSQNCGQYHYRYIQKVDRDGESCPTCEVGTLREYVLTDQQLAWIQHRRKTAERDEDSIKVLLQELSSTAEEAFQVSGYQVFGQKAQEFANSQVRPPIAEGDFDAAGKFHGPNTKRGRSTDGKYPCFQEDCTVDHEWDEAPLKIWEWPRVGAEYCVGADVSEGLGGRSNYSVGVATRISTTGGGDYQVATWRANTIDPIGFAYKLNFLGLYYNTALMSVECNRYDICLGTMRFQLGYPNCYRWKHLDSMNIMSNKLGWWTNLSSRPRLWQTFKRWLQQELFYVRSHNLAEEMKNFVKDDDDSYSAGGDQDETDDELLACMIALYTAHEGDWNDALGMIAPKSELTREEAAYHLHCANCGNLYWQNSIEETSVDPTQFTPTLGVNKEVTASGGMRCPACGGRRIEITRNRGGAGTLMDTVDPDAIFKEAAGEYWDPSQAWDSTQLNYDYDLPTS